MPSDVPEKNTATDTITDRRIDHGGEYAKEGFLGQAMALLHGDIQDIADALEATHREAIEQERKAWTEAGKGVTDGYNAAMEMMTNDFRRLMYLLASIHFYGGFKAETANERKVLEILESYCYTPKTEEELLALPSCNEEVHHATSDTL